jgi:hypothetical protein
MGGRGGLFRRDSSRRLADALGLISFAGLVAAAPSPSVSLDGVLAPPPAPNYAPDTESNGTPVGAFDAAEYASYVSGGSDSSLTTTLTQDGFVAGYGASWTEQTNGRALVELVVAFSGGTGARSWLATAQAAARSSDYYKRSIVVLGVGPYYGAHFANPSGPSYADVVSFVKGNDFFTVGFISNADDLGTAAAMQAKKQFDTAPADSIPPSQWPENLRLLAGGIGALKIAALVAAGVVVFGFVISFALFFYVRKEASRSANGKLSLDGEGQPPDG